MNFDVTLPPGPQDPVDALEDPILEAFPVMVDAAENFCRGRHEPGGGCYHYHRLRPYLRAIRFREAVWRHGPRFLAAFRALAATREVRRVLISGSADYSLLAHVLHAFRGVGVEPEVTVMDLCEAPLAINRWYAGRMGARITTVARSVFDYSAPAPFDLITTDNFFSQFTPDQQGEIVRRWWHWLRPGGVIVGTQTVTNAAGEERRRRTTEENVAMRDKVLREVARLALPGAVPLEELGRWIDVYRARDASHHPFGSAEDVLRLCEDNGFLVDRSDLLPATAREQLRQTEKNLKKRDRLHFVARRRNEPPRHTPAP